MRLPLFTLMLSLVATTACNKPSQSSEAPSTANNIQKAAGSKPSGPKAQTACELLTPVEIAGFLKVPAVKKDELNSGKNAMTKVDFCNWYVKENNPEGVQLALRRAESDDEGSRTLVFSSAKGDAVEHDAERDRKAEKLIGVGDEAIYAPYPDGKGGNVAMRVGASAVTITGSASRDDLISMAKLAGQRM